MNSFRPFQTKLMEVDQISKFWPNFTISAKFHNPGIPGVRAVSQFCDVFFFLSNWVPFFFLPKWVPHFFLSPCRPPCPPPCQPPCVVHLPVGGHVSHHVGHRNIISTLCEVSGTLAEWKSEESMIYGLADGQTD